MKSVNFSTIDVKWQKEWAKAKVFEAEVNSKKPKFFLTTPYPYISGSLHIGHGRAVVESDVFVRYKRMKGFNVLYPMAFHISGTPVLGISSAIKNKDKKTISLYEGYVSAYVKDSAKVKKVVESFIDPQKIVDFFIPHMIEEYSQLGLSIDWRRSFTSGDLENQKLVQWQFEKYKELGYITKGKHPVLYSVEDESAMGEDDIKDADSNPVEKAEFTLLKFKFGDKFLVAATLRPETIFGQTNLWVNPSAKYHEARVGDETWIISKEALEKLSYQLPNVKDNGITKEKLLGKKVLAPIINRELMILPSNFVDLDIGTGIVTSVPGHAPYDYVALKILQDMKGTEKKRLYGFNLEQIKEIEDLEIIPIIKTEKYGDKAAVAIVEKYGIVLLDDPRLDDLMHEVYKEEHHTGIMLPLSKGYNGMAVKQAKDAIKQELIKKNQAGVMYETSRKAFSRSGGKIIVAVLDGQWFLDFNHAGWKDKAYKALEKTVISPDSFRKLFEDTFVWLDKRPCARKRGLGTNLPFDSKWVIESLSDSTIYMVLYTINHLIKKYNLTKEKLTPEFFNYVFLNKGNIDDLSKKLKIKTNVIQEIKESFEYWMPVDHRHTFPLHLSNHLSFMIFAFAALFPEKYWPKRISFHGLVTSNGEKMSKSKGNIITLLEVKKKYGADMFRFYLTHSTSIIGEFDWKEKEAINANNTICRVHNTIDEAIKTMKSGKVDPYYTHKFESIKKKATSMIDSMKLREYNMAVIYDVLNLVNKAKSSLDAMDLSNFYGYMVKDWIKLIAPVIPHTAEELWSKLKEKGFVSSSEWPRIDEARIDATLDEDERVFDKIVSDIQNILKIIKEKENKEWDRVYLYVLPHELNKYNSELLSRKLNISVIVFAVNDPKKFDPEGKASKAKLGKPAIYVV